MGLNVLEDLKDKLVADGIGTFAGTLENGWNIYLNDAPDSPDQIILLSVSGSWQEPNAKWAYDYPTVQVRVRGKGFGFQVALAKLIAIKDNLLGAVSSAWPAGITGVYKGVWLLSDISYIAKDEKSRPLLTLNLRIFAEPTSAGNRSQDT